MKKLVLRLAILLLIVLIGLGFILGMSLERVVRNGVILAGPEITKVDVKLADVKLSVLSGSGELKGLVIGNPEEFKTPSAIDIGHAKLVLSPHSVLSEKVVIRSLQLEDSVITLEGNLRRNNLSAILKNIEETTGRADQPSSQEPSGPSKKFQVDEFIVRRGKVNLSMPMLDWQMTSVILPDIELRDLGQGPEGITAAELSQLALTAILEKASAAAGTYLSGMGKELGESIKQGALEKATNAAEKALELLKKKQ